MQREAQGQSKTKVSNSLNESKENGKTKEMSRMRKTNSPVKKNAQ